MTPGTPRLLSSSVVTRPWGGRRIQRILGRQGDGEHIAALVDMCPGTDDAPWTAAYVDASAPSPILAGSGVTFLHVLWTEGDRTATIAAGDEPGTEDELRQFEVHPGDTLSLPAETPFQLDAGILAFVFADGPVQQWPGQLPARTPPVPPTHGLQVFHGHNRRTLCAATPRLLLERWKITQPLDLELNPVRRHYLTNLVEPVAFAWPGGSQLLERTRSVLLPSGIPRLTIVPNGLGYVLLGYEPELEPDVILPLQAAGYDRATIASVVADFGSILPSDS